jgi:hypothetical protein
MHDVLAEAAKPSPPFRHPLLLRCRDECIVEDRKELRTRSNRVNKNLPYGSDVLVRRGRRNANENGVASRKVPAVGEVRLNPEVVESLCLRLHWVWWLGAEGIDSAEVSCSTSSLPKFRRETLICLGKMIK